ncbi:hypothetical protein NEHOM01_2024 [Nematocida homosporus]|uniref:uncharacterized protein n=1 Tax=Nematocida homosporus TaxID=1912981 RepID=UPI0022210573|nr:uncharacterized protein NEHOM01_2024 [Nematocida homosporus]KAI5187228.1 hypothetical protein NEHOM01_2024 [Nematocida homosporus]
MIHINIPPDWVVVTEQSKDVLNQLKAPSTSESLIQIARQIIRWSLLLVCFFYFGVLLASFGYFQTLGFFPLLCLFIILVLTTILWKAATTTDSNNHKISEPTRFFICVLSTILLVLPALIVGNPWPIYLLTHMIIPNHLFLLTAAAHLIVFIIGLAYADTNFQQALGLFPVLMALAATLDYTISRLTSQQDKKPRQRTFSTCTFITGAALLLVTTVILFLVICKLDTDFINYLRKPIEELKDAAHY